MYYLQVSHKFLSNAINNHVTRQNIANLLRSLQNEAEFFFSCQITSRCICLRLITAHPSFCIFSTRLITLQLLYANYKVCFSASSLTSLEEKNNNNTLVFISEPDAHKFDNGNINQRKVTCKCM